MNSVLISMIKGSVQIAILTYIIYFCYDALSGTKGVFVMNFLFFYFLSKLAAEFLNLDVIYRIMDMVFLPIALFFVVTYNHDLKKIGSHFSQFNVRIKKRDDMISSEDLDNVIAALYDLASKKRGALVIFKCSDDLSDVINKNGTLLDCKITSAIITTIFEYDTQLHDGAIVIDHDKIVAAGCFMNLSERTDIKNTYGTRHRAALGLSESSDAVVVVVSEEMQSVSVCYRSNIIPNVDINDIKGLLIQCLGYNQDKKKRQ